VGGSGSRTPPAVRLDAQRLALGRSVSPHPLLMMHLVAKEFGIAPWEVESADAGAVMRAWMLMSDLQPKERRK
jgi:hypothetical protein